MPVRDGDTVKRCQVSGCEKAARSRLCSMHATRMARHGSPDATLVPRVERFDGAKRCGKCSEVKPLEEFHRNASSKDGRIGDCKGCRGEYLAQRKDVDLADRRRRYREAGETERRRRRIKKYGISDDEYEALLIAQRGLCAICHLPETKRDYKYGTLCPLAIDHDHETGVVRGLLCNSCNRGIGLLKDDAQNVRRALAYLERSERVPA